MISGKIAVTCLVIVLAMLIVEAGYKDYRKKEMPDWFKATGGLLAVVGFVSFLVAAITIIWS